MGGNVKLSNRSQIQVARRGQAVRSLEFFDRFRELGIVAQIGSLALEPKPLAQLRHAPVFHLVLAGVGENRPLRQLFSGGARLVPHGCEHRLEPAIGLVRRAELLQRRPGIRGLCQLAQDLLAIGERELAATYAGYPMVGFQTVSEQSGMLLVNHTLTGLAIGAIKS